MDFHCVEGWGVDDVRWGGVAPSVLFEQAGVKPEAKYAVVHAYGGEYLSSLPLDLMRDPQTMLADQLNGDPLPPKHGGPLRLVVPKQLGYKNVKWVARIELSAERVRGYWESYGYPEDAPIPGGLRRSGGFRPKGGWAPFPAGGLPVRPARYTGARAAPPALPTRSC